MINILLSKMQPVCPSMPWTCWRQAGWIIHLRYATAHDPGMFGLTQRPRPPASAWGLLFVCNLKDCPNILERSYALWHSGLFAFAALRLMIQKCLVLHKTPASFVGLGLFICPQVKA
jgi:hypothetical protein